VPGLRITLLLASICLLFPATAVAAPPSQEEAIRIALRIPQVKKELRTYNSIRVAASRSEGHWQVLFFDSDDEGKAEVDIDLLSGRVLHVFTGEKASFPLTRGPQSGFAKRKLNSVWIWVPLTLIFIAVFVDPRRPWRLLHLDLIAVAALGISFAFWMKGNLDASVPLVYPTLVYVLVRMLIAGLKPRERAGPITRLAPRVVIRLTLALVAFRIGLTLADTFVSDIGYASAAGANRVLDGLQLYTRGGAHFDTYGPLAYLLYIPFLAIWPFHESQANTAAAEAAAIAWEILTVAGLVVLGRQHRLGWTIALAWAACPFTALAVVAGSNDGLVAATLVWALVASRSAALRGALGGASAAAKIAPGFILPVLARGTGRMDARRMTVALAAAAIVILASLIPLLPPGGLSEFYDATIGFQLHRDSPFSLWSQHPGLVPLQSILKVASLGLALVLAVFPRGRRSFAQMTALSAAVLVAAELPLKHWFYLYVPWFLPLYCAALFIEHAAAGRPGASQPLPRRVGEPASYTARS
jgi:Glycosyltransferase family 87